MKIIRPPGRRKYAIQYINYFAIDKANYSYDRYATISYFYQYLEEILFKKKQQLINTFKNIFHWPKYFHR